MAMIYCVKMKKEGMQLPFQPMPGEIGKKIHANICQEAWEKWLGHQTILINEYRLNLLDPEAKKFLQNELQKFLFEDKEEKPEQFTTPE